MNEFDIKDLKIILATRKPLIIAILLMLGGLVLITSVILPQINETNDLYAQMQKEQPKLDKLEQKVKELESIQLSPEYAQINVVNDALPSKKPLLELLMALSTVSQQTGTIVKNFELSPGLVASDSTQVQANQRKAGDYDSLSLELSVQGTFKQIQDFLLKVEEVSPFTTIVSMEIGNQINANAPGFDEVANSPVFEAVLTNETYFFTQPLAVRVDAPLPKIANRELLVLDFLTQFVRTDLPTQTEIRGGGQQDLFQVPSLLEKQAN